MYSVLYRSVALPEFDKGEIYQMLSYARDYNHSQGITGCLLYHRGQFLQLIEGDYEEVTSLFGRIQQDPRHTEVTTLEVRTDVHRIFDQWDMAFHDFGEENEAALYKLQQIDSFFNRSRAFNLPSEMANQFFKNVRGMLLQAG